MKNQLELRRFNVYIQDQPVLDFIIPSDKTATLIDDYWEARIENVVERISVRLGLRDPIAIFDETFCGALSDNLSKDGISAYVYAPDDTTPDPEPIYAH